MKRRSVLTAVLLFLAGCGSGPDDDVVARAGNLELTREELRASISYASQEDSLTVSAIYVEDWKALASLYQLALDDGIGEDAETRMLIEKATRQIIVQRFVDKRLKQAEKDRFFAVDSSDVKTFYREFPDMFVCSETEYAVARYYAATAQGASRMGNALMLHDGDEESLLRLIESIDPGYAGKNLHARKNALHLRPLVQIHLENEKVKGVLKDMAPGERSPVIVLHDSLFVVMEMHDIVKKGDRKTLEQAYGDIEDLLIVEKQKQYYTKLLKQAREKYQ